MRCRLFPIQARQPNLFLDTFQFMPALYIPFCIPNSNGGALFRNGEHAEAVAALNQAVKLHGKPSLLTHGLLALTCLQMGEKAKAKEALAQAPPAKDAP